MKQLLIAFAALVALAAAASFPDAVSAKEDRVAGIEALGWMAGQWRGTIGGARWEASYTSPDGGVLLSANKQIQDGKTNVFEFEHFAEKDGKVVMTLYRFGKPGPSYEMTSHDAETRLAVFVNEEQEFPREIRYQRVDEERFVIDVIGTKRGKKLTLRLDLKKS